MGVIFIIVTAWAGIKGPKEIVIRERTEHWGRRNDRGNGREATENHRLETEERERGNEKVE